MNRSLLARHVLRHVTVMALMLGAPVAGTASTLRTVALGGQSAPGLPDGISIRGFSQHVLNDAGQVVFVSLLAGNNVDATNNRALWFESPNGLTVVARTGSRAPGTPEGVNFGNFLALPGLDNSGRIVFVGALTGNGVDDGNNRGIWSQHSGRLSLVARAGSPAPGTPAGVSYARGFGLSLNNNGQTTFSAQLTGSGVDSSNDRG
ncbi:MAG TPA: choice-of-anchor tandem repeat NxxGxxAF-containing protein, partial [Lacipirellulaceae bacterium]